MLTFASPPASRLAGLTDAFLGNVIIYVILLAGIVTSFYVVERVGRRPLVLYCGAFMAVVDAAIGGLGFAKVSSSLGAGLISLCAIWVFTYSMSLAPIGEYSNSTWLGPIISLHLTSLPSSPCLLFLTHRY